MDATDRVNDVARNLQNALREAGFEVSEHEAQALSVVGLIAAAEVAQGVELDAELLEQGRDLVARILEEGARS